MAAILALVKETTKLSKFTVGVSAAVLLAAGVAGILFLQSKNAPPKNPALARRIIQGVFSHVNSPLPAPMRFIAEVELVQKPWTEAQILAEVQRQEDDDAKRYEKTVGLRVEDFRKLPEAAQEQRQREQANLREIRLESTRTYHGTRTFIEQEWLSGGSGGLLRLDQRETTPKSDTLRALDKALPTGVAYEKTMIYSGDTNLARQTSCLIDHRLRSAWFNNSNWEKSAFWEAATLEPQFGFILTMAVGDVANAVQLIKTKPKSEQDIDSFTGVKLDTNKLEALATGKDRRWKVETDEAVLNGRKVAILRLKGKTISLAHGIQVAFFVDVGNVTNIYRIELTGMPLMKTPYISIRDDFDTNGFPHTWIVESPKENTIKKTVKFKEAELQARFDTKAIFSPEIPSGYSINRRAKN